MQLPDDPRWSPLTRSAVVVALFALAQLARLRLRVPSGSVSVTWGEAALIIGLYLAPAGWLPAATFIGVGAAWLLLAAVSDHKPADALHTAASMTVAVAAAAAVTTSIADPLGAAPTPVLAVALVLGSLAYLLVTAGFAALCLAQRHGVPMRALVFPALRGKLLMFVGNVVVGLVVIVMLARDPLWLLALPPGLWLLQQTYGHRLRADDERRAWEALAEATGSLNQLDEDGVAAAGVRGALTLSGAERVQLDVVRPGGPGRRFVGESSGVVVEIDAVPEPDRATGPGTTVFDPDATDDAFHSVAAGNRTVNRPLSVGEISVGELRIWYPGPAMPGPREQLAMATFADALGGALHDAATHRELRLLTDRSSHAAVHDPLTGLTNRAALLTQGESLLRLLDRGEPVALLLLDIDHFKEVNETLGHSAGDQLLVAAANRLTGLTRPGELLARLGGDEFALLTPIRSMAARAGPGGAAPASAGGTTAPDPPPGVGPGPLPTAVLRAREIVERLAVPIEVAGVQLVVEASVGVVVAGAGMSDMAELVRRADIAMYHAKDGGVSVAAYDDATDAASTDELALLAELREALATNDQLCLALQPAVDLVTGMPTGVEALIRWHHPRRGWLMPGDFIRVVEGSELLRPFTRYVVDRALTAAADWAGQGLELPISVNVSARSLLDRQLAGEIAELLRRHRVPAHRLVLEITETVVMSEQDVIDEVLAELRAMGVQLSVDDFGTGYSSLTFLTRVAVNELKIDRSFVGRMADSTEAAAIVRTTVDLGRALGLRVVAEGVETAAQRLALADLGCNAAQGYHFCKPLPSDKIVPALRLLGEAAPARVLALRADDAS
ncbi:MAG TPA: bifunctional diguanylate cyclase/phosphodiesterase [Catenuloplanes sp.]